MRIAYLTQSYPPMISGAALAVEKLATAMAQRGHQVLVIAASDRERPYHTYKDNLTIIRLSSIHNPMRAHQRFLLFPQFAIIKALKKFQPDIIHVHEPLQTAWAGISYARQHKLPITMTVHQLPAFAASYLPNLPILRQQIESLLWMYARALIKQFTAVITPSHNTSGLLANFTGIKANTISNGIDLQRFHPPLSSDDGTATRTRLNLPSNVPILLHIGRLDTDKSVDKVIRAAAPAIRESEAQLLIVGDGCEKKSLMGLCHTLGIAQRVHFTNLISDHQYLSEIYRMASIFITASEIETQGIVLLEAAASGLPIVAVDATCISEIVHDQVSGFLTMPGNIPDLSNRIITLLNNPERARMMGIDGRTLVEAHDIHRTWSLHEKLYLETAKKTHTRHVFIQRPGTWELVKARIGFK